MKSWYDFQHGPLETLILLTSNLLRVAMCPNVLWEQTKNFKERHYSKNLKARVND